MGPQTRDAIRDFQKKAGVGVDGDVGPQTRQALAKALSEVSVSRAAPRRLLPGWRHQRRGRPVTPVALPSVV